MKAEGSVNYDYELTSDSNGCYWAKCPPQTCPVDLPRRLREEYWAEIVHVKAQYWRCVPAPRGDDFRYYIHPAKGPGPGAFWACEVEVRSNVGGQIYKRSRNELGVPWREAIDEISHAIKELSDAIKPEE